MTVQDGTRSLVNDERFGVATPPLRHLEKLVAIPWFDFLMCLEPGHRNQRLKVYPSLIPPCQQQQIEAVESLVDHNLADLMVLDNSDSISPSLLVRPLSY